MSSNPVNDAIVVGAGAAGRAIAGDLAARGLDVLVLERRGSVPPSPGIPERPVLLLERGRPSPWPASVADALLAGRLGPRALWRGRLARMRRSPPRCGADDAGETAGALVRRHVGRRAVAGLLAPLLGGHGWPPDVVGAAETLPALVVASAAGRGVLAPLLAAGRALGAARAPGALARGVETAHATEVIRVVPGAPGAPAEVRTRDGRRRSARRVVLAVSAAEQARLLEDAAPHAADLLGALPTARVARVRWDDASVSGPGAVALRGRGSRQRAFRLDARPDGRLEARYGGAGDFPAAALPPELLTRLAAAEFARLGIRVPDASARVHVREVPLPRPGRRAVLARLAAVLGDGGVALA